MNARDDDGCTALCLASEKDHVQVVKELLKHESVEVNAKNDDCRTSLLLASYEGHSKVVRELLKHQKVDVNAKDDDGTTALIAASEKCHLEVIVELLKHRELDVNARNENDATALLVASELGNVDVVRKLLTHNCDAVFNQATMNLGEVVDDDSHEGSNIASWNGFSDIGSKVLGNDQLDVKVVTEGDGSDLLKVRAAERRERVAHMRSFAHVKVDVNAKREDGATALILASCNGHLNVVAELLIHKEVDVNAADIEGATALMNACANGHLEVVCELLKRAVVTYELRNDEGSTDDSIASGSICNSEAVDWDLMGSEHGHVPFSEVVGRKEFHTVSADEKLETVKSSVNPCKLDVNAKNCNGATALIVASGNGHVKVVCELLKHNVVDMKAETAAGETCSILASRNGHAEVVCVLQKHENAGESARN